MRNYTIRRSGDVLLHEKGKLDIRITKQELMSGIIQVPFLLWVDYYKQPHNQIHFLTPPEPE